MSEQRFICGMGFTNADVNFYNPIRIIHDNENDKDYYLFADLCKIMNEQQAEIENKYGIHYGFLPVMNFNDAEFDFKEHYLMVDSNSNKKIPYEIIEKIEVVGK